MISPLKLETTFLRKSFGENFRLKYSLRRFTRETTVRVCTRVRGSLGDLLKGACRTFLLVPLAISTLHGIGDGAIAPKNKKTFLVTSNQSLVSEREFLWRKCGSCKVSSTLISGDGYCFYPVGMSKKEQITPRIVKISY